MNKLYYPINWENYPSEATPINESNLNKIDSGLNNLDNRVIEQDALKLSKTDASNDIVNWTMDEETGVITITRRSGEQILFDLNIEKIPVSFSLSDDGILTMVTDDGTTFTANIGAMIPILTFSDSDEIAVTATGTGINKTYSFSIKDNSITENKLQPNFLADIKVQSANASLSASNAETNATKSQSYAVGGTGTRGENEDTDNAKYYYEQTKKTDIGNLSLKVDEINSNLNSEISRAKEADEILKSRVDNIASLPDGSTTGDAELLDIRVKVDGTTATSAGNAVREQVSELKGDLGELNSAVFGEIIESDVTGEVLTGTIIDARTGAESTKFQYSTCTGFIDVSDNADYCYSGKIYNYIGVAGYDLDGNFVAPVLSDTNEVFTDYKLTIPVGVSKIRASSYSPSENTRFPLQVVKKEKTSNLVDEVSSLNKNKENITIVNHIYVSTTGSDTSGDGTLSNPFATIYHANDKITDATEMNQYIIHVADGIYTDLQTRYAGIKTHENYEGIKCKPWVIYEGNVKHPEKVVIQWDGKTGYGDEFNYNNHAVHFCPFHITGSNGWKVGHKEIRGFTFDCKNTRYALHVEMSSYGYGVTWKVSDCIFVWHGVPDCSDISYQIPTVGTGSGHYEKGHLLRCRIVNDSGITDGFRNHDSRWVYGSLLGNLPHIGAEIIIEDCVFNAGDSGDTNITFRNIYEDGLVDGYNRFSIINCTGINRLGYSLSGNATKCDWRTNVKCSDITNNVFATEGLLQ